MDALPYCISNDAHCIMAHLNFIVRQKVAADASNKLFFVELEKRNKVWVVIACRVVRDNLLLLFQSNEENGVKICYIIA